MRITLITELAKWGICSWDVQSRWKVIMWRHVLCTGSIRSVNKGLTKVNIQKCNYFLHSEKKHYYWNDKLRIVHIPSSLLPPSNLTGDLANLAFLPRMFGRCFVRYYSVIGAMTWNSVSREEMRDMRILFLFCFVLFFLSRMLCLAERRTYS